jgi:hypothetical protein
MGVIFCEKCGAHLPDPNAGMTCANCGKVNRPEVRFCEFCGNELVVRTVQKPSKIKIGKKNHPKIRKFIMFGGISLEMLISILMILYFIGDATQPNSALPILLDEPGPIVVVQGLNVDAGTLPVQPGQFSIQANAKNGVRCIEVYSDGNLVAAKNIDPAQPNQQVVFAPAIEELPTGEHEVIVRVYDHQGQVSQSSVMPVIIDPSISGSSGSPEPLVIEDQAGVLPAPTAVSAQVKEGSGSVQVSWTPPPGLITGSHIYVRWPGTSAFILVGKLSGPANTWTLPVDKFGNWQVSVASLDANGKEGSLARIVVNVPDPATVKPGSNEVVTYAVLNLFPTDITIDRLYGYVRLGGAGNRYQRLPANNGDFLQATSAGKFSTTVQMYDWPVSQPLPVDLEIWGWSGSSLQPLSAVSQTINPLEYPKKQIEISGSKITASILFQTQFAGQGLSGQSPMFNNEPRNTKLPAPSNLHMAFYRSDCELVTTEMGELRNLLRDACRISVSLGVRNFMIWDWPPKSDGTFKRFGENDISGFEFKFVLTDSKGKTVGEKVTSIPFPQARGYMRDYSEVTQPVDCGIKKAWYVRTISRGGASDWVYAGSLEAKECVPEYPPYNGCGGQSDKIPDLVPDLIFESSCNDHDKCYESPWSGHNKVYCDNVFLKDMLLACVEKVVGLILPEECSTAAFTYYEAVNLVGRFFYVGDIDAIDCITEPAVDPTLCLAGTSPEIISGTIDIGATAYNAGKTIVKSGYSYTKDGAIYLGEKTMAGLEAIGEGISGASGWVYDKVCPWSWCR